MSLMKWKGRFWTVRASELTVEVSANLTVSDKMADRCLALLEWWQNDHNEQRLMATTNEDGSIHLYREKKEPYSLRDLGNGIFEKAYDNDKTSSN